MVPLALTSKLASASPLLNAIGAELALDLELLDIALEARLQPPAAMP